MDWEEMSLAVYDVVLACLKNFIGGTVRTIKAYRKTSDKGVNQGSNQPKGQYQGSRCSKAADLHRLDIILPNHEETSPDRKDETV